MKLFPSVFALSLLAVTTIAPLGASAANENIYRQRIGLITKYEDGYSEPFDPPSGTIQCIDKPSGGTLKTRLFRSIGGKVGELRGIVSADARTTRKILGWKMDFQDITPADIILSDNGTSNLSLQYESNLKRRIRNTSGLPGGRSRESGGQAWIGLDSIGAKGFQFRFHGGAVYDAKLGLIRMFRQYDEAATFDFDCPVGIGPS
jgi:hypothetical protein